MLNKEERAKIFREELNFIQTPWLREYAEAALARVPDYFFSIPASSSGKYHPQYALGISGLVRHTKAAMRICQSLSRAGVSEYYLYSDPIDTDFITPELFNDEALVALLLHDTHKWGVEEGANQTVFEHPLLARDFVLCSPSWYPLLQDEERMLSVRRIASAISTHMGKWTVSKYSPVVLPPPESGGWLNKFVHMCDYLASRQMLEFNFTAGV